MVRQYANSCASPGAMSSSSNSSSSSSSDLNAIERLMTQLMHEPTCHQFALGPIGTPQKRHESFSSSNASTPASSTKKSQQRAKHHNKSKNNQRPRLDSTSSLNKTPVRPTAAPRTKSSSPAYYANMNSSTSGSECEERFAGARFTLPPSPDAVPLPPAAWFVN